MSDSTNREDALANALRDLRPPPMDPLAAAESERAAKDAFEEAHGRGERGLRLGPRFARVVVPLGLAAVVVVYLSWAVSAASALQME